MTPPDDHKSASRKGRKRETPSDLRRKARREIEQLARCRHDAWANGAATDAYRLTVDLEGAFDAKRLAPIVGEGYRGRTTHWQGFEPQTARRPTTSNGAPARGAAVKTREVTAHAQRTP